MGETQWKNRWTPDGNNESYLQKIPWNMDECVFVSNMAICPLNPLAKSDLFNERCVNRRIKRKDRPWNLYP